MDGWVLWEGGKMDGRVNGWMVWRGVSTYMLVQSTPLTFRAGYMSYSAYMSQGSLDGFCPLFIMLKN